MTRKTSEDIERKIERAKSLRGLVNHPGWMVVAELLSDGVKACRNRLLMPDCDYDEVRQIRGVVSWLQNLLRAPEVSDETLTAWEKEVAFRRKTEKIRDELGLSPAKEQSDEVQ